MGDFDAVLERLLTDPAFPARLAADPEAALAGYTLAADEIDLLRHQVAADAGASTATVEQRVTKSSTFGLFGSFGGLAEAPVPSPADGAAGIGPSIAEPGAAVSRLGDAPRSGFGDAPLPAPDGYRGRADASLPAPEGYRGRAEASLPAPEGYRNRVDADGDGGLDRATYRGHHGGGAEILVDLDGDGRADFIGVDRDLDNRVDHADYDKDHDGVFEKRMYDDDGDGWLDRSVRR